MVIIRQDNVGLFWCTLFESDSSIKKQLKIKIDAEWQIQIWNVIILALTANTRFIIFMLIQFPLPMDFSNYKVTVIVVRN